MAGAGFITVATVGLWQRSRRAMRRRLGSLTLRLSRETTDAEKGGTEAVLARAEKAAETLLVSHNDAERRASRLAGALDAMPVGVVLADDMGMVEYRNVLADSMTGGHGDAVVQRVLGTLLQKSLREDRGTEDEVDLYGPPRQHYRLRAQPIDDGHRSVGIMATVDDHSERKRLEDLRRAFTTNAGEHLRNPAGALAVLADMVESETDSRLARKVAARLGVEARRVVHMLDDLIELARLEAEEGRTHQAVSVGSIVNEAVARATPLADTLGVRIEPPPSRSRVAVVGERRQLVAALFNVVDNAVRASARDASVVIDTSVEIEEVRISVTDQGVGIPTGELERIFERFYRIDRPELADGGSEANLGAGLGLSIVRHVVDAHGGRITVRSQEGAGSAFTIELPVADREASGGRDGPPTAEVAPVLSEAPAARAS
jgi:two-component system, OmpR family, sensor histidine kinase SenX3